MGRHRGAPRPAGDTLGLSLGRTGGLCKQASGEAPGLPACRRPWAVPGQHTAAAAGRPTNALSAPAQAPPAPHGPCGVQRRWLQPQRRRLQPQRRWLQPQRRWLQPQRRWPWPQLAGWARQLAGCRLPEPADRTALSGLAPGVSCDRRPQMAQHLLEAVRLCAHGLWQRVAARHLHGHAERAEASDDPPRGLQLSCTRRGSASKGCGRAGEHAAAHH